MKKKKNRSDIILHWYNCPYWQYLLWGKSIRERIQPNQNYTKAEKL